MENRNDAKESIAVPGFDRVPQLMAGHQLRFAVPEGTSVEGSRLQQLWWDRESQDVEWRDVPTVVVR